MTVAQYEQHYQGWLGLAENGRIQKTKFVDMMVTTGGVDKEMAQILFDTYDADGSGYVSEVSHLELVEAAEKSSSFGGGQDFCGSPRIAVFSPRMHFSALSDRSSASLLQRCRR